MHPAASSPPARSLTHVTSARQRALWRAAVILDGTAILNHTVVYQLRGELDVDALVRAVRMLSQSQQLLHAVFTADGSHVAPGTDADLRIHDVRGDADPGGHAVAVIREVTETPFRLTEEPLFRASLVTLDDLLHYFVCTLHVLIWDRRSISILLDDLAVCYRSASEARPAPGGPAISYHDLAAAECAPAIRARVASDTTYWRRQLSCLPAAVLPGDLAGSPPGDPGPTGSASLALNTSAVAGVRGFCRQYRCTLFVTAASALLAVLNAATGQDDLRVATAIDNRRTAAAMKLIGPFSQGFVLRVHVDPHLTFGSLAHAVQRTFLEGLGHQAVPFDDIVELLERDGTPRARLADPALFAEPGLPAFSLPGIEATPILPGQPGQVVSVGSAFDLRIMPSADPTDERQAGVPCVLNYDARVFSAARATALLDAFARTLATGTAEPDTPVAELPHDV
jgi:Condensation domain